MPNMDQATVVGFGRQSLRFHRGGSSSAELSEVFDQYFSVFPWENLDKQNSVGADFGCGTGRWAKLVSERVGHLHVVEASSDAIGVARGNLAERTNVTFHNTSVEESPIADGSLDFAFSLGVLHHMPNTPKAIGDIERKLKPGAPFLIYLYYALDNRPAWYRAIWRASDLFRRTIQHLPFSLRWLCTQITAAVVYWPCARIAKVLEGLHRLPSSFPLAYYRDRSFYVMRMDAHDRLATNLEQRFSKSEILEMLTSVGFENVRFSDGAPYWCAVANKKK